MFHYHDQRLKCEGMLPNKKFIMSDLKPKIFLLEHNYACFEAKFKSLAMDYIRPLGHIIFTVNSLYVTVNVNLIALKGLDVEKLSHKIKSKPYFLYSNAQIIQNVTNYLTAMTRLTNKGHFNM